MRDLTPKSKQVDISRGLPKTGLTTSYQAGDDGQYEAGWWQGRLDANNRTRFIIKTIGGGQIVLDRATGLMWARAGSAAGGNNGNPITWANGIIYAEALTFATFSDWRMPNVKELMSIMNYEQATKVDPVFINIPMLEEFLWTSTTYRDVSTRAYGIEIGGGEVNTYLKTEAVTGFLLCVRKGI